MILKKYNRHMQNSNKAVQMRISRSLFAEIYLKKQILL